MKRVVVVQPDRGQLKMQAWPKRRGKPTHPTTLIQNSWLTWSARALKYTSSIFWEQATIATKGTGLYPRDLLTLAADGRLYDVVQNDGQVISRQDTKLEIKMFNGAILNLTASVTVPASVVTTPDWSLPIIDTFTFWDVANPKRLTIPEGVDVVEVFAGALMTPGTASAILLRISKNGVPFLVEQATALTGDQSQSVATGPITVVQGDYLEMAVFSSIAKTLAAGAFTFFSLNVLGSH